MLERLLKAESSERDVRSINYQMKTARFPAYRDLTGFDFGQSTVDEALVKSLYRCLFLEDAQNVVLVGGPGTGKTHLAAAIGVQAIQHHRQRVRFPVHHRTGQCARAGEAAGAHYQPGDLYGSGHSGRTGLLAIQPEAGGALLFHLISKLYERTSSIITTNLGFAEWSAVFGDEKLTTSLAGPTDPPLSHSGNRQRQLQAEALDDKSGGNKERQETQIYAIIWRPGWVNFKCKSTPISPSLNWMKTLGLF